MTTPSQRQMYLEDEGDAWFQQNQKVNADQVSNWIYPDPLADWLEHLPWPCGPEVSVSEVGCGQGLRLTRIRQAKSWSVVGLDPSEKANAASKAAGCQEMTGAVETLPLKDHAVDLLIYGFCLYLCVRNHLFRIAAEAHRVLTPKACLAILDFWSPHQVSNTYHHLPGIQSYTDSPPCMFNWNPFYAITYHRLRHHTNRAYTNYPQEWLASRLLRRCDPAAG